MFKIFYGDSVLVFADPSCASTAGGRIVSPGESFANIVENLEKYKHVAVLSVNAEQERKAFMENFRLVDAAGGLVSNPAGELLMIHRNGRWDLPKGHREEGEDTLVCAVREVFEETGVHAVNTSEKDMVTETFHFYELRGEWVMKRTYWYSMRSGANGLPVPQTEEGIASALWVSRDEVAVNARSCFPSVREVLEKAGWLSEKIC